MTRPFVQQLGRNFQSCPGRIAARRRRPYPSVGLLLARPRHVSGVLLRVAPSSRPFAPDRWSSITACMCIAVRVTSLALGFCFKLRQSC